MITTTNKTAHNTKRNMSKFNNQNLPKALDFDKNKIETTLI